MMSEPDRGDIVNDYRPARARLRLAPYDAWLAEWIAHRVARLLGKRDAEERGGDDPGDAHVAGERAVSCSASAIARGRAPASEYTG